MKVAIVVPMRRGDPRREELWDFTRGWLEEHHSDWLLLEGDDKPGPFNRGYSINTAAKRAAEIINWDVLVIHDGDNVVSPAKLKTAVQLAHDTQIMHYAHDTYFYCDKESSDEMMAAYRVGGAWFPRPQIQNVKPGYAPYTIHKHVSGVQAVPREVWDNTGGFIEWPGWGGDDSVFAMLCNTIGGGVEWVKGTAIHFWHPHAPSDVVPLDIKRNRQRVLQMKRLERIYSRDRQPFLRYLNELREEYGQSPIG